MESKPILGVIGGLGPMSSAYFYELLTEHTCAKCDQDHIDLYVSSRASTPDRTAFLTGKNSISPLPVIIEEAKKLVMCGADVLAIPCNTAYCFIEGIREAVNVPVIDMIEKTVEHCKKHGIKKAGILATEGTVMAGIYQRELEKQGLGWAVPEKAEQAGLTEIIYGQVKQGKLADMESFRHISDKLRAEGCDTLILGCTELPMLKKQEELKAPDYVDSLEVLAYESIKACGRQTCGFDFEF